MDKESHLMVMVSCLGLCLVEGVEFWFIWKEIIIF